MSCSTFFRRAWNEQSGRQLRLRALMQQSATLQFPTSSQSFIQARGNMARKPNVENFKRWPQLRTFHSGLLYTYCILIHIYFIRCASNQWPMHISHLISLFSKTYSIRSAIQNQNFILSPICHTYVQVELFCLPICHTGFQSLAGQMGVN